MKKIAILLGTVLVAGIAFAETDYTALNALKTGKGVKKASADFLVNRDLTVGDDISVTDDAAVGGDLTVTGTSEAGTYSVGGATGVSVSVTFYTVAAGTTGAITNVLEFGSGIATNSL